MTDIDQARTREETAQIRELNDQLRISHTGGTLVTTPGVLALGIYLNQAILIAIAAYEDFDEDNDSFGEPLADRQLSTAARNAAYLQKLRRGSVKLKFNGL